MDSLITAAQIVLPLFLMMAVGCVIRLTGIMNESAARACNKAIFTVFLPLMIFHNLYNTGSFASFDSWLLVYAVAAVAVEFSLALIIAFLTEGENSRRGVMLQGMFRSNFVIFGLPVCAALFGDSALGTASLLVAVITPLFNILSVIALEMFRGQRPSLGRTLLGILRNPLIIASILGLLCLGFGVRLPSFVEGTVSSLGSIATPLAFVMLGACFSFKEIGDCLKDLSITLLFKLILFPALFLGLAIALGFRGIPLAVLLAIFASPVAVASFTMAQQMDGDGNLASQLVVFSSLFSVFTLFVFVFLLRYFAFL